MAISFDAASADPAVAVAATSLTYSYTVGSLTGRSLFVGILETTDAVTGVTYAGVPMFFSRSVPLSGDAFGFVKLSLYYLSAPAVGANNIVITANSPDTISSKAYSCAGSTPTPGQIPDFTDTTEQLTGVTSLTASVLQGAPVCWTIGFLYHDQAAAMGNGANTVLRGNASAAMFADSNGPRTPPGVQSLNVSWTGAGHAAAITASLQEAEVPVDQWFRALLPPTRRRKGTVAMGLSGVKT